MTFDLAFRPAQPVRGHLTSTDLPSSGDDYETAVIRACSVLAEVESSRFEIRGFGRDPWSVDVGYDMSAFLEQLPELVSAMRSETVAAVDLYPQGVESTFEFQPIGDRVDIRCTSRTGWIPDPSIESITRWSLVEMLARLVRDVVRGLGMIEPRLLEQAPFNAWARGEF